MPTVESKEAAKYSDQGSPQEHCSICAYWAARATAEEGGCRIVSGRISAAGWCRHFLQHLRTA